MGEPDHFTRELRSNAAYIRAKQPYTADQLDRAAVEIEALRDRVAELQAQCGYSESIQQLEIERLRSHNAALVEIVRDSPCPYNGRRTGVTVGECQQCGCSHGLLIKPAPSPSEGGAAT